MSAIKLTLTSPPALLEMMMSPANNENRLPLSGKRIMITRPIDQAGPLEKKIIALGGEAVVLPTISTEPFDDISGWEEFKKHLLRIDWIVFTSENGVRYFVSQLKAHQIDSEHLKKIKIAAIGHGTTASLESFGLKSDFVPTRAIVDSLVDEMPKAYPLSDTAILRVRGNLADDIIEESFVRHRAEVIPLTVYRTTHSIWSESDKDQFLNNLPDAVLFTSGSTVLGLLANLDSDEFIQLLAHARIFSIGPKVTAVLREKNIRLAAEASEHNIEGLIDALENYFISN